MLAQPYHVIGHRPKLLESTLCQRHPDGSVLFQHRQAKWILHGNNPWIEGFRLERECRTHLGELAGLWDGRVFNPPPRSEEARRMEADLSRREFRYVRVSSDEERIELLSDHRLRPVRRHEHYWHIADGSGGLELRFEGNGLRSCALRLSENGAWRGRYLQAPGMPVELVPIGADLRAEQCPLRVEREAVVSLLDRVLDLAVALPWDREVARDLVGALHILAALDMAAIERLKDEAKRSVPGSARAQVIEAALAGLVDPGRRPDGGGIAAGHNWVHALFELGRNYER